MSGLGRNQFGGAVGSRRNLDAEDDEGNGCGCGCCGGCTVCDPCWNYVTGLSKLTLGLCCCFGIIIPVGVGLGLGFGLKRNEPPDSPPVGDVKEDGDTTIGNGGVLGGGQPTPSPFFDCTSVAPDRPPPTACLQRPTEPTSSPTRFGYLPPDLIPTFLNPDFSSPTRPPRPTGPTYPTSPTFPTFPSQPTVASDRYGQIFQRVSLVTDPSDLQTGTPQMRALRWIAYSDPVALSPTDPGLIQRYVLTTLYYSLNGAGWNVNRRWLLDEDVCNWHGISCDTRFGTRRFDEKTILDTPMTMAKTEDATDIRALPTPNKIVTGINLEENSVRGTIPPEIGALEYLEELSLHSNGIVGSLPFSIGNLSRLKELAIYKNSITGTLPTTFGQLSNLEKLYLEENKIRGNIPTEIGRMVKLQRIDLYRNMLSGELPRELGQLRDLKRIWFSDNNFRGTIPTDIFRNLGKLGAIYLENNMLGGTLPPQISQAASLYDVRLHNNTLSGRIPQELGNLRNMIYLYLDDNQFDGQIPTSFGRMSRLKELALFDNRLQGTIPTNLGSLTQLAILHLGNNNLVGQIPKEISRLNKLNKLRLYRNSLGGNMPDLSRCNLLDELQLQSNTLRGTIPPWLGRLRSLDRIRLNRNQFSGPLPDMSKLTLLEELLLDQNSLTGTVPQWIGYLSQLGKVGLGGNKFTGPLPQTLLQLSSLKELQLVGGGRTFSDVSKVLCSLDQSTAIIADCNLIDCPCCTFCDASATAFKPRVGTYDDYIANDTGTESVDGVTIDDVEKGEKLYDSSLSSENAHMRRRKRVHYIHS